MMKTTEIQSETSSWVVTLGYDPRPQISEYRGTPIPDIQDPLKATPRRIEIADYVWWNGPYWTVLRNSPQFLYHVTEYARTSDFLFITEDVPRDLWIKAIRSARVGRGLSRTGLGLLRGIFPEALPKDWICDWHMEGHLHDYYPFRDYTRQDYLRHNAKLRKTTMKQL